MLHACRLTVDSMPSEGEEPCCVDWPGPAFLLRRSPQPVSTISPESPSRCWRSRGPLGSCSRSRHRSQAWATTAARSCAQYRRRRLLGNRRVTLTRLQASRRTIAAGRHAPSAASTRPFGESSALARRRARMRRAQTIALAMGRAPEARCPVTFRRERVTRSRCVFATGQRQCLSRTSREACLSAVA